MQQLLKLGEVPGAELCRLHLRGRLPLPALLQSHVLPVRPPGGVGAPPERPLRLHAPGQAVWLLLLSRFPSRFPVRQALLRPGPGGRR